MHRPRPQPHQQQPRKQCTKHPTQRQALQALLRVLLQQQDLLWQVLWVGL